MKILQTIPSLDFKSSGPTLSVAGLCRNLSSNAVDISLMSATNLNNQLLNDFDHQIFAADRFGQFIQSSAGMKKAVYAAVPSVDLVHSNGMWAMTASYACNAALDYNKPLIIAPRGSLSPLALKQSSWKKKLAWPIMHRRGYLGADCFHATSEKEYREIREFGLRAPVAIVPNGIDKVDDARQVRLSTKRILLFLGRLHPIKGVDLLLEVWATLPQHLRDKWELRIVGPNERGNQSSLESIVYTNELNDVVFVGEKTGLEKTNEYMSADLYVLPTKTENFGMTIAEALAAGTPVITTHGAPWEGLLENECGWWIERSANALSETLIEAMSLDNDTRQYMGSRGRSWVEKYYAWDVIALQMKDVYAWLIGGKKGGAPSCIRID